jgi:UDP-N-acetylmuramate--alanine ligase
MTHIHLIGIGGAGLSAIATVLLQQNYVVSGSDRQESAATRRLQQQGATVFIGQRPENLTGSIDVVVISSAIAADNPELLAAHQRGLRVVKRAEWLGEMMAGYSGIAVAGTHGKTTTTAMIAFLLREAGADPSFIVGGFVPQINTNAAAGSGHAFVIEADEYDHMFLGLRPTVAVITIVEWDHPDIFAEPADLQRAFAQFVGLVSEDGLVIGCGDTSGAKDTLAAARGQVVTYGLEPGNDWRATALQPNNNGGVDFQLVCPGSLPPMPVTLVVPGKHNVLNAVAALIVAHHQGIELAKAARILGLFKGVQRRFQVLGEVNGVTIIDDYAHHPTEIKATLAATRDRFPHHKIWAVFQPHTFSRTRTLFTGFVESFQDADRVVVLDIYPARERDEGLVHSRDIVNQMKHPHAEYVGTLAGAIELLPDVLQPPAVLMTLGAGDSYLVAEQVLAALLKKESYNEHRAVKDDGVGSARG